MNIDLEVRRLPLAEKSELVRYLEENESWKKLMKIVPEFLSSDTYTCDILPINAKYRSNDFHIIERASNLTKRDCSEIFLREWGTSGRVRPTLGHLKFLLEKAQLYHAADFITVQLLKQERPSRPQKGPAAPIEFNSDELENSHTKKIEKLLNEMNYPSSAIQNINNMNSFKTNLNYSTNEVPKTVPKIIISESPDVEDKPTFNVPLVVENIRVKTESEISDMMKFSTDSVRNNSQESVDSNNGNMPHLSSLLTNESSYNLPAVVNESCIDNRPNLSSLLSDSSSDNSSHINLSDVNLSASNNFSSIDSSTTTSSSGVFPALSQLLGHSDAQNQNSRPCPSPLPNLSLNTPLPHYTYCELERATQNFDEISVSEGGRFLGAGNFGKVYLAELGGQQVAVKKLILGSEPIVLVDDRITRQFTAEVEILSRYRHENLARLFGYSCDGMTYCLVYEYIPGGALTERIQRHEFIWTERFYIALGTARAIAFLHTAYDTPVIHRDVKSANILLDANNKPKLCDFGLVKSCLNQHTSTTTPLGTSAYMAPEGSRGDVSPKLDTYSFGVVLLELLTSLAPVHWDRGEEGIDLVTYVDYHCQEGISRLLDRSVGSWQADGVDFGQKLYEIAQDCVLERRNQRPTMIVVCEALADLAKSVG